VQNLADQQMQLNQQSEGTRNPFGLTPAEQQATRRLSAQQQAIQQQMQELGEEYADSRDRLGRIDEMARTEANTIVLAAEQEIAAAAKNARRDLKVFTADLAVGLAEKRIRETISGDAEKRIFRSFVKDLGDDAGRRGSGDPSGH